MRKLPWLVCTALLASCSRGVGNSPMPAAPGFPLQAEPLTAYKLLYSFKSGNDAGFPYAGLTEVNGTLYGTTYGGGGGYEWGTVFKLDTSGQEHVLYRFKAGKDGAHPYDNLTLVGSTLYGTTYQGGTAGSGTVFKISTSGAEQVIYSFKGGNDGQYPYSRLLLVGGALYGTTYQGGVSSGWGTVFKVTTSGQEHVIYRFKAGNDGAHPYAGLIAVNGVLYGTTYQGGTAGAGTVFKVTTAGAEHVVYSFQSGIDGQYPQGRLLDVNGALYGTTFGGGSPSGWGTVFKLSLAGTERVIYRFKAGSDGAHPYYGGLVERNGTFFGTTYQGGVAGAGTVFAVSPSGSEHVVYSFKGGSDGQYPYDGLTDVNGTLYGTTYQGGGSNAGTAFKVVP